MDDNRLLEQLKEYFVKYFIPEDYVLEILDDSKVIPMIRGKATEYSAYLFLKENLNSLDFDVSKLNINAQSNQYDEDISITHRRTGERLKVEVKNACRGEFNNGKRTKILKVPHFKVKCHRSRSNMKLAKTTNDRYVVGDFDLLVCNPLNSIYEGATFTRELQFIDEKHLNSIKEFYKVETDRDLEEACHKDWRFVFPEDIAEEYKGEMAIPRTPYVKLKDDENWFDINSLSKRLEEKALKIAQAKKKNKRGTK